MNNADVLIIGGGIAGCTTGIALRKKGIENIVVLERLQNNNTGLGETIPGAVKNILAKWQLGHLTDKHLRSAGSMSSWGSADIETRDAFTEPAGAGWHLNRSVFENDIKRAAASLGVGFYTIPPASKITYEENNDVWKVFIDDRNEPNHFTARIIIDATGSSAAFARAQGCNRVKCDELVAVAAWFTDTVQSQTSSFTLLETMPYGWFYTSALPGNKRVCVLFSDADILRHNELLKTGNWFNALAQTKEIATLCHEENMIEGLVKRPAASGFTWPAAGGRWLCVGDALYSVDPLSSSGIYNALFTGEDAAETMTKILRGEKQAAFEYAQRHRHRFERYLFKRFDYYRLEKRWPQDAFWQRRYGLISLSPNDTICLAYSGETTAVLSPGYLPKEELNYLFGLCQFQIKTEVVIKIFKEKYSAIPERLVILALQERLAKVMHEAKLYIPNKSFA